MAETNTTNQNKYLDYDGLSQFLSKLKENFVLAQNTDETLEDVDTLTYIKYVSQILTNDQKLQVATNIGNDTMTPGHLVKYDENGTVASNGITDGNILYAFPNSSLAESENVDIVLQDRLISGTNIKTINGESVLGSGDLKIDELSVDTIKSIISDDCKIYYQGIIDTSILPAFGDAVLIADISEGGVSFEGQIIRPIFKTLIFDRPITVIPDNAFINQTGLKSIIFPSQIGSIGANIFEGCTTLCHIDISNASVIIPQNTFTNFTNTAAAIIVEGINNSNFELEGFVGVFKEIKYTQLSTMIDQRKIHVYTKKTTRYFENNSFSSGIVPNIANSIIKFKNTISGNITFNWYLSGPCTVIFSIGETVPTISFNTSTYKWANDNPPTFKANKTYEIYFPGYLESQCLTWVSYSN